MMKKEPLKALIGGIQKFSIEDGPGIRTTVFLKGCPLDCKWCHNPELIDFTQQIIIMPNSCISCGYCVKECPRGAVHMQENGKVDIDRNACDGCMKCTEVCYAHALQPVGKLMTVDETIQEVEQDRDFYKHTEGGLTISGGEVLSHADFAEALIEKANEKGIGVCIDTSGCGDGDRLRQLARKDNVTHVLYDVKSIDADIHKAYTGTDNAGIMDNLKNLSKDPQILPKLRMRMPLVDGVNDTDDIAEKTAELYRTLAIKHVTLLPYHNLGVSKKRNIGGSQPEFKPPGEERIKSISKIFSRIPGVKVDVSGNL
jgi:pyruvate formate lyase activating enzyme